ncbi:nuclear envelope morphology protein 1 [Aspergillus brasiliensis]|uniref:Nuclear envelope morphology protein 1 n=1 Tax=Aspergillus brasiliensis TaxID=319629 RepID=A0A9W5YKV0_9EURO|nr:nuclear envelope morphology protein 1 [Aspergillus brasiliensis]GKZ42483.1 nuclear envelope morphology protein 1 [Aspergillus brasiliensis]
MNSLNILSSRVIGQSSLPARSRQRSRSQGDVARASEPGDLAKLRSYSESNFHSTEAHENSHDAPDENINYSHEITFDEKSPLLRSIQKDSSFATKSTLGFVAQRFFDAIAETIKFILSTIAAPGFYVAQCFEDDNGHYSFMAPVRRLRRSVSGRPSKSTGSTTAGRGSRQAESKRRTGTSRRSKSNVSRDSIASSTSESEGDRRSAKALGNSRSRTSKAKSSSPEPTPDAPRRSIRIKLHSEEALKRQRQRRSQSADLRQTPDNGVQGTLNLDSLKSPTSPSVHRVTRYPHSPVPPRPLIPPRVPSYTANLRLPKSPQKTLVLDLDETLIHSLAKGGRMSSGHMVEVKLSTPMTTALTPGGPPTTLGPQHPILYYVHKRPHCDEFLRKISKWYKLVIFTASVQEYADPVIDWLEQERKYFQARYYRQHCTFRNGAYIKDLSSVEPDLSKVMILDNSPMSYIFHEDNAIPIEGWINDPTDNGLLHLVPMLEALQYVTDVRAFLALRRGETEA